MELPKQERPPRQRKREQQQHNDNMQRSSVEQAGRQSNPTLDDIYRRYIYLYDALCETDSFFTMFQSLTNQKPNTKLGNLYMKTNQLLTNQKKERKPKKIPKSEKVDRKTECEFRFFATGGISREFILILLCIGVETISVHCNNC